MKKLCEPRLTVAERRQKAENARKERKTKQRVKKRSEKGEKGRKGYEGIARRGDGNKRLGQKNDKKGCGGKGQGGKTGKIPKKIR
jgi:hypothetical protein